MKNPVRFRMTLRGCEVEVRGWVDLSTDPVWFSLDLHALTGEPFRGELTGKELKRVMSALARHQVN